MDFTKVISLICCLLLLMVLFCLYIRYSNDLVPLDQIVYVINATNCTQ